MLPAMIPCQRHLFDVPEDVAYFNCAYMAPLLAPVRAAASSALDLVARPWQVTAPDFFAPAERARALFAQLVGASPEDVAIVPSASYGVSTAARNLRLGPGRVVLLLDEEFPSNVYPWRALAARDGGEITAVRRPPDGDWTAAVLDAIDRLGDRLAIAALPQCHWTDGSLVDLERIAPALHRRGAHLVLDLTQSLGALPFDVRRVRPAFVACAGYKWLLGAYGLSFLYAAPEHQGGEPLDHNWITRAGSEDFAGLVLYRDEFQPGARRFDMGERASFVLLQMAIAGLEQILAWTPEAIAATLGAITSRITTACAGSAPGITAAPPAHRGPHLLGLRFHDGVPPGLVEDLRARRVFVSVRGQTVRIGPHLWIRDGDVERLLGALGLRP
jgi:selenocysteine lyase/cysteine desulfurase